MALGRQPRALGNAARESLTTPDAALMTRLAEGDLGALGEIYDRHRDAVHRFVVRATAKPDDADDLVQNTFLTSARIASRFDGRESCRPWLIGIAARLLQEGARQRGTVARFLSRFGSRSSPSPNPESELEARSALEQVTATIARMTTAKRIVLLMVEVEGLSCSAVAAALEIPIGTVWTRLHAARRELRAAVPEWREP
jgi:RNA polymerase sigma-70 factor (ECF subfamily)